MKIRIKGNHLRFRLRQHDVATLCNMRSIVERIEFGETADQQISFSLESYDEDKISITYENNFVKVFIPRKSIDQWANTDQVEIEAAADTGKNKRISVLIEKDLACLDASEEDNIGTYPNPLANC